MLLPLPASDSEKSVEVAPIGVERVAAGAAFGREHVEEQLDQFRVGGFVHAAD